MYVYHPATPTLYLFPPPLPSITTLYYVVTTPSLSPLLWRDYSSAMMLLSLLLISLTPLYDVTNPRHYDVTTPFTMTSLLWCYYPLHYCVTIPSTMTSLFPLLFPSTMTSLFPLLFPSTMTSLPPPLLRHYPLYYDVTITSTIPLYYDVTSGALVTF